VSTAKLWWLTAKAIGMCCVALPVCIGFGLFDGLLNGWLNWADAAKTMLKDVPWHTRKAGR
jgi:hypothetical protein